MFDPLTTQLIRSAPPLSQLDLERLPQALTQAFTAIVGFRVQMGQAGGPLPDALRNQLDQFRRLANTFESLVILLPNRENRAAAAYVAGQAHHLLHMARQLEPSDQNAQPHLRAEAISPVVSALLLFLVADQPSDAMELAKSLRAAGPAGSTVEQRLVEALALLAEGRPQSILELAAPDSPQQEDVETEAVQALFFRLWEGLRILSGRLSNGTEAAVSGENPEGIFRQVQELAVGEIEQLPESALADYAGFRALATYAGPHHLAALLIPAAARLQECATVNVPMPPGTDAARWATLRGEVVRQRPFLWRNHRDAVTQGFLEPGTSAVVSFPTGAGKTTLSELKIASTLAAGGAVLYLAPTHALVSQVKRSLQQTFSGVVVGDSLVAEDFYVEVGEDSLAEIAVMTPERCLALLSITPQMFQRVRLVIFDECHLLHPQSPGRTRRSVDAMLAVLHLARVAPQTDWLLLSAMMSNADELAGWLGQLTGRRCLALKLDWKPTRQARGCLVFEQNELDRLQKLVEVEQTKAANENAGKVPNPPKSVQSLFQAKPFGFFCLEQTWQSTMLRDYTLQPLLDELVSFTVAKPQNKSRWHLNPNKSEMAAQLAARCAERGLRVLLFGQTIDTTAKLAHLIEQRLLSRIKADQLAAGEEKLRQWACLEVGSAEAQYLPVHQLAGCHHGDMLPVERTPLTRRAKCSMRTSC
ncbi:MAG: DEAD/DEAH box helicase [Planctomycetes bacterium]|nr:DEAD/DEAH box helicase [Planctomycetota bacterium]